MNADVSKSDISPTLGLKKGFTSYEDMHIKNKGADSTSLLALGSLPSSAALQNPAEIVIPQQQNLLIDELGTRLASKLTSNTLEQSPDRDEPQQ